MASESNDEFEYDVALSFAGEDRAVAEEFANLLKSKDIKVFYDEDEVAELWGKDLIAHLADLYQNKARYCVMFISKHYPLKRWTSFERTHIQARAFRDVNEYILPIRLDDTEVPGIAETMAHRDIRQHSLESIANTLEKKLAKAKGQSNSPSRSHDLRSGNVPSAHNQFGDIPMPQRKKTFTQLEKDRFARESFNYIKQYFKQGLKELESADRDIQTDAEDITNLKFTSRIYVRGDIKAQCNIWIGDGLSPNTIHYNEGVHRLQDGSINDYLPVEDNGQELRLRTGNFGIGIGQIEEPLATQQQAAEYLWKRFIAPLSYR